MTPKLKSKMEQMAEECKEAYFAVESYQGQRDVQAPDRSFKAGFTAAYDILMPIIEVQHEALDFYAQEDHWSEAHERVCPAIIMGEDIENRENSTRFYGGKIARKALDATKESLG